MNPCVIIGGGPAGLAASAALTARGIDHLILERGQVGQSWRTQRWDSFRLNTPGWMNPVLGEQPRDAYLTGPEVVKLLEDLGARAPVYERVTVSGLEPAGDGFVLRTSDGQVRARTVIAATGGENVPYLPPLSTRLPDRIAQVHVADYRSPGALPAGSVLVVGSAQSGCQVAEDLVTSGRRVTLATSPVGRVPTPYRGRDTVQWLAEAGFFDQRPSDLPDPSLMHQRQPVVAPGGRGLSLQALARSGVTLAGRLVDVGGEQVRFDDTAAANVAAGDAFAARVRTQVDGAIASRGVAAAPAQPDAADVPIELSPTRVDLRKQDVSAVVWCTGFTGDFSWLGAGLVDVDGKPRRRDAAAPIPGLWYLGLRWLIRRASSILYGLPGDADTVADAVRARLSR
jgi:putative flavoprotein involved in K+ transport